MANAYKIVGQANPGTATTDLYTVPSATEFVGVLWVGETGGTAQTFRVSVASAGTADAIGQYIARDGAIAANDSVKIDGIALAATDKVRVYGSTTDVTFTIMGVEIT